MRMRMKMRMRMRMRMLREVSGSDGPDVNGTVRRWRSEDKQAANWLVGWMLFFCLFGFCMGLGSEWSADPILKRAGWSAEEAP